MDRLKVIYRILLVSANDCIKEMINIQAGESVVLSYRKYMVGDFNPERVPAIWVHRSPDELLLCREGITPELLKASKAIDITFRDGQGQLQHSTRTWLDRFRPVPS